MKTTPLLISALLPSMLAADALPCVPSSTQFCVNTSWDIHDNNLSDRLCEGIITRSGKPVCSLRAAIEQANAIGSSSSPIQIILPAADYQLSNGTLTITTSMSITGDRNIGGTLAATLGPTVIHGGGFHRVLRIEDGSGN